MMTNKTDPNENGIEENHPPGLPRTNADKRMLVRRALLHPYARGMSDRQISRHVGVHHNTVGRARRELEAAGILHEPDLQPFQQYLTTERQKQASGISEQTRHKEENGHEN